METEGKAPPFATGKRPQSWLRILRPLFWWALLVLAMFGYRTHQRLAEQTHLDFSVSLEGQPLQFGAVTTLDGKPVASGERVPLGRHTLAVSHPKAESYSTNLSIWYGEHRLGTINLRRSRGTLTVTANPAAATIRIQGPEFSIQLTNSAGLSTNVPTDRYTVEARYGHWQKTQETTVFSMVSGTCAFAPKLGSLQLTCNQSGASFQVANAGGQLIEAGDLPAMIAEVPEGSYRLIAWHHRSKIERTIVISAGTTNSDELQFLYGAIHLESDPAGATVVTAEGQNLGVTPLSLSELTAGKLRLEMRLAGYSSATADLEIAAGITNTFRANLVSLNYSRTMTSARQYLAAGDYDRAIAVAAEARQTKANDADAIAVENEAVGKKRLRQAVSLGKKGDYIGADKELEATLQSLPENEEAKQLLADFRKREPEQIEHARLERAERGKKAFDTVVANLADGTLFENHELTTAMPLGRVQSAIIDALKIRPEFRVTKAESIAPETFEIEAVQQLSTVLATSAGYRQCVIVGAQTRDDETQILFKVLEYKAEAVNKFSIGAVIGAPGEVKYVPIHPSRIANFTDKLKTQVEEGVKIVTERLQQAVGGASEKK